MFLQILTASGQLGLAKDSIQPSCNQLSVLYTYTLARSRQAEPLQHSTGGAESWHCQSWTYRMLLDKIRFRTNDWTYEKSKDTLSYF